MDKTWVHNELKQCLDLVDEFGMYPHESGYKARMDQALKMLLYVGIQELIITIQNKGH